MIAMRFRSGANYAWALLLLAGLGCKEEHQASTTSTRPSPAPSTSAMSSAFVEPPAPVAVPPADLSERIDKALPTLRKMALDPAVLKAVHDQNAKKMSLDDIKKLDEKWTASTGIPDFVLSYLENPCAKALRKDSSALPAVVEAFAMDNQGGLVGTIAKTSDYWQGDEAKWQKSFADGKGAEFIDKPTLDKSSQTFSVQVSLPLRDGASVIGAITVGLAVDKL